MSCWHVQLSNHASQCLGYLTASASRPAAMNYITAEYQEHFNKTNGVRRQQDIQYWCTHHSAAVAASCTRCAVASSSQASSSPKCTHRALLRHKSCAHRTEGPLRAGHRGYHPKPGTLKVSRTGIAHSSSSVVHVGAIEARQWQDRASRAVAAWRALRAAVAEPCACEVS
jgi:hypothetical protein